MRTAGDTTTARVVTPVALYRLDSPEGGSAERVPELDAVRGLVALAVVLVHSRTSWLLWG